MREVNVETNTPFSGKKPINKGNKMSILKKYGNKIVNELVTLPKHKQLPILKYSLERQLPLVRIFDETYEEDLCNIFKFGLDYIDGLIHEKFKVNNIKDVISQVESNVPDSDEFGDDEGEYGQNALISLLYGFQFIETGDVEHISSAIDKVFESVDIFNLSQDKNYDEKEIFKKEISIFNNLMDIVKFSNQVDAQLFQKLNEFINENPICL